MPGSSEAFRGDQVARPHSPPDLGSAVAHPINTVTGLWRATNYPIQIDQRIVHNTAAKLKSGSEGQGEVAGATIKSCGTIEATKR